MEKIQHIEGFAGHSDYCKEAESRGYKGISFEIEPRFNPTFCVDLLTPEGQLKMWEYVKMSNTQSVWMSIVCTSFSLASGNKHWDKDKSPKTEEAIKGLQMLDFAKRIAEYCQANNKFFFIENPNGRAVWFLPDKWLKRVWYCQYGDIRAKPTNIWTNLDIEFRTCHNGNPKCHHERAPRGSKIGTQGLKDSESRSRSLNNYSKRYLIEWR